MDATTIVYLSAEVIVSFITIVGNCLVLGALIKSHQLHTVTNVFVGNLAVADIAVGVLVAPCAALSFLGLPGNFYACVFINCLILTFTNVSILMLLFVAIERFIAIKEPFVYQRLLTTRRAFYVNFFVWILGWILGLVPMYGWHHGHAEFNGFCSFTGVITYQYMVYFQFFGLVLLPLFVMLCIYIYILLIVRRHMRQTNALHNQFRQSKDAKEGFNSDVKAAKMFALVIFLFGVFWIPVNLFNCVSLFCGLQCPFPLQALLVAIVMSHANSSINPFLYATSNSRIKRGLKELLGMKVTSSDRTTTDYENKRRTSNGKSYARDNSVAPISSVADYNSHSLDDHGQNHTGSQKALLAKTKVSILPSNPHLQNGTGSLPNSVSDPISDTDIKPTVTTNSHVQDNRSITSRSWLSALTMSEKLSNNHRPESQNSNKENSNIKNSRINILQETSNSLQNSSTTPPLMNDRQGHHENKHNHTDINRSVISVLSIVTDLGHDDSANVTKSPVCDKSENMKNTHSTQIYNSANTKNTDTFIEQLDNASCWTTSVNPESINGSIHELPHPRVVNGKQQYISANNLQTTNLNSAPTEELLVNNLNGYVSPIERALSVLSCHSNSLIAQPSASSEVSRGKFGMVLDNLQRDTSVKSDINLQDQGPVRTAGTDDCTL